MQTDWTKRPWMDYGIAIAVTSLAALLRWALPAALEPTPFLVFYPALVAAAMLGGFGPGMVATAASSLCYILWLDPDPEGFRLDDPADRLRLAIFVSGGMGVSFLARMQRRAKEGEQRRGQELYASEERFRLLIEDVKDYAIFMLDMAGRVATWNAGAQRLTQFTEAEIVGAHISRFHPPADIAAGKSQPELAVALETGHYSEEGWRVRKDGSRFWANVTITPLYDPAGNLRGFAQAMHDMTEYRDAEERLRKSEHRYRTLFGSIDEGFCVIEVIFDEHDNPVDYRFLETNPAFEKQTGLPGVQGKTMRELAPQHEEHWFETYGRVARTGQPSRFQAWAAHLHRWFDVYAFRFGEPESRQVAVLFSDITERKRTEEVLRRRAKSLKLLSDCAMRLLTAPCPEPLLQQIFDDLAKHLGLEVYLNYLVAEDGWLHLNASAGLDDQPHGRPEYLRIGEAVCGTAAFHRARFVIEDVQHSTVPQAELPRTLGIRAIVCYPLLAGNRLFGTLCLASFSRDGFAEEELDLARTLCNQVAMAMERTRLVVELEQWAADLNATKTSAEQAKTVAEQAKAVAEQANVAKDHFLAVLSHELRTPLTPVVMGVSMLQDRPDLDATMRQTLEMIRRNVEMEARLIDDLLDVTRIARGKIELARRPVELCTVIQRAVEVCKPDIEARGLHFGVDLGPPAPYWVDADVPRLQQVFWNLLKNAIKFTPHGGCVGIRCRPNEKDVVVEVNDSGMGMEQESLSKVFNAFEQIERSITRQFGGLGLGLAISKALVEMHGGTIEAHSEGRGKGATFRIRFPMAAPPGQSEFSAPAAARQRPEHPLRILLVEDHGITAKIIGMILTADGHTVDTAGDIATALQLVENHPDFDLLISDLGLPDGSGHDLLRKLRHCRYRFPAIALSGYGGEEDIRQSLGAGFAAHLTKPASRERLMEAIATVTAAARV